MKPVQSPLECISYFVTDLSVTANRDYHFDKESDLKWGDIDMDSQSRAPDNPDEPWQITLRITQNLTSEKNLPYNYSCEVVGFFAIRAEIPEEKRERTISIHGSSMLYSVAREILRSAMSKGPYMAIMLPTVSFFGSNDSNKPEKNEQSNAPVTRSRKGRSKSKRS